METGHTELTAASSFDNTRNGTLLFPADDNAEWISQVRVLLVEDDLITAKLIQDAFAGPEGGSFCIDWVTEFFAVRERLVARSIDIVLLEMELLGYNSLDMLDQILRLAPDVVVLMLCNASNEGLARAAVERGAHDYLVKDHIDNYWWPHSLRYVVESRLMRNAVRKSDARFRAISDASPLGIFISDVQGNCIYANETYQKIAGLTFGQTQGTRWSMVIHPDDRQRVESTWQEAMRDKLPFQLDARVVRPDKSVVWTRLKAAAMQEVGSFDSAAAYGHVQTLEDITARKSAEIAAEEALFEERESALVALNSIGDAVLTTNLAGQVTYLNHAAETMTGWLRDDALGQPFTTIAKIVDGSTNQPVSSPARRAIIGDRTVTLGMDCLLVHRDGSESPVADSAAPLHNRDGQVTGAVIVFHDVSHSRAAAVKMTHLAQHDFLTGLPNRALLTERLLQSIGLAHRHGTQVAVLFIDLDFFKHINDSLGHGVGDLLLQSAAERLMTCVRASDTVCRLGGDEFVILLAEVEQLEDAACVAEKLLAAFVVPHPIGGHELHLTISIGISVYPDDGLDVDTLMQNADAAMYHAKVNGRNNFQFFLKEMNARVVQRLFVKNNLHRAIKLGEFLLHYQSQIDLATGAIAGVEALVRWQDPNFGLVQPAQFVPVAEECGLIIPIGKWVLREACRQVQAWLQQGLKAVPVAVNISALEFRQKGFLDEVALILAETGLAPRYLELELTESVLMQDAAASITVLNALKGMGIRLAIDDFGTGYSSLSYLKRFPIDTLKIDQSFVSNITADSADAIIVSTVIDMARNLGLRLIAEGVETSGQLAFLQSRNCEQGQGFVFGHPLPACDFGLLLPVNSVP